MQRSIRNTDRFFSRRFINVHVWEWLALALILGVAVFLRFRMWDYLEFGGDCVIAMQVALGFIKEGRFPFTGLMSSVGVANPPLFIYLLLPVMAISSSLPWLTTFFAATSIFAIIVTWRIGRRYYDAMTGIVAAAMFAVSPWAVIYSRKIWAQDLVPMFSSLTLWALHALTVGKKERAIFWVVFLPLCVIQIHFSGFALTAAVFVALLLLRPKFDWRFAISGIAAALIFMMPYLYYQMKTGWADFRQAAHILAGAPHFNPNDLLIDPRSGCPLSNHHYLIHALGIINGGEIEDLIGLDTAKFEKDLTIENGALWIQQLLCVLGLIYLAVLGAKSIRWSKAFPWASVEHGQQSRCAWILVCWITISVMAYWIPHLGTLLSYYVIFYPAPYLICAVIWKKLYDSGDTAVKWLLNGLLASILLGNLMYIHHLQAFVARNGGAYGSHGTTVNHKQEAARFLAEHYDVRKLVSEGRIGQMMQFGLIQPPEGRAFLAMRVPSFGQTSDLPSGSIVLIVDRNRTSFSPQQWAELNRLPKSEFGPIQLYIIQTQKLDKQP